MVCRHCRVGPVSRPRGLCWTCYYREGVRDLYPSTSKFGRRGLGNFNGSGARPLPTDALPGTEEKVRVLMERVRNRQALSHPEDADFAGPRRRRELAPLAAG
jgi:hypothetical protein